MDPAVRFIPDDRSCIIRGSALRTCCVNASNAKDRIVRRAPKEARYLLVVNNEPMAIVVQEAYLNLVR